MGSTFGHISGVAFLSIAIPHNSTCFFGGNGETGLTIPAMARSSTRRSNRVQSHEKTSQTGSAVSLKGASVDVGVGEGNAPEGNTVEGNTAEGIDGASHADGGAMEDQGHGEQGVATQASMPMICLDLKTVKALCGPIMKAVERRFAEYLGYHQGTTADTQGGHEEAVDGDVKETESGNKGGKDPNEKARTDLCTYKTSEKLDLNDRHQLHKWRQRALAVRNAVDPIKLAPEKAVVSWGSVTLVGRAFDKWSLLSEEEWPATFDKMVE
ncbi:hypothetical protein KEM55_001866 [Ascosphaera atra]|nr:hypothetical protein KEM55_001866 [Ascosphaera atra]